MRFNEDSRVKVPALLHLSRLGYDYLSLKQAHWDPRSNLFPEIFEAALLSINHTLRPEDIPPLLDETRSFSDNGRPSWRTSNSPNSATGYSPADEWPGARGLTVLRCTAKLLTRLHLVTKPPNLVASQSCRAIGTALNGRHI